ncbi:MAG: hypothetical protein REI12_06140 [Pedobacter sp.]|nr:hypothetical protein [Pedobacter sp.]
MVLSKKISLATLVLALAAGVSACNKPAEPTTDSPSAAEQLGTEAGQAQQSTSEVLSGASDKLDAAADQAKDAASDAKQSANDAKADFQQGYEAGKRQEAGGR